jgi:hypothetical protein
MWMRRGHEVLSDGRVLLLRNQLANALLLDRSVRLVPRDRLWILTLRSGRAWLRTQQSNQLVNRHRVIDDRRRATAAVEELEGRVEAQELVDRSVDVFRAHRPRERSVAVRIG